MKGELVSFLSKILFIFLQVIFLSPTPTQKSQFPTNSPRMTGSCRGAIFTAHITDDPMMMITDDTDEDIVSADTLEAFKM